MHGIKVQIAWEYDCLDVKELNLLAKFAVLCIYEYEHDIVFI